MTRSVGAVVVHHHRFPGVLSTVRCLLDAGVPAHSLVVVDNSEDDQISHALTAAADGWSVHVMPNRGYGAAANAGVALLSDSDVVLVVTHEVRIDRVSVAVLVGALDEEPLIAAAGPSLLYTNGGRVWSRGGALTRRLRLPRQLLDGAPTPSRVRDVDWVDGACVLYRTSVLAENPFREDFFMYFEETELHARLRFLGWRVVTVDGGAAYQSTEGMPPYWGCRNFVLFQRAHGTRWSRLVAPIYFTARTMVIATIEGNWAQVLEAPKGLFVGLRTAGERPRGGS